MSDSNEKQKMASLEPGFDSIINQSSVLEEGTPIRYHLNSRTYTHGPSESYRKITFGERDTKRLHKTILMVGETGTGKTKLINTMINYMLGVKRENKVWFEITDDQSDRSSVQSQTTIITVYGFYLQESPIHLTIIDTPGYGDTRGIEKDKDIARNLLGLSKCDDCIQKLDVVCLAIKADQNRLSDRQQYIFDAVQSLFGKDIAENIVLLLTHSRGTHPKDPLTAVKEAKIKCAVNDKNQPVYFLFDNCQGETFRPEYRKAQEQSWDLSFSEITAFFKFTNNIPSKPLKMTEDVLQKRMQLEANVSKIQSHIQKMDPKQNQLKQAQDALKQNKKVVEENEKFEYEVNVTYKERVDIDRSKASVAMCCTVCQENCHYPGCWWISGLSWCSVMKNNHCTVCTNKCHYSKHVKATNIYTTKTVKETKTNEEMKKKYNGSIIKVREGESLVKSLEEELQKLEIEKVKLVMEAFHCVETLDLIALNTDSLIILLHVDYLIEKLKEISEPVKAKTLEDMKKRAGEEKNRAVAYMKEMYKSNVI